MVKTYLDYNIETNGKTGQFKTKCPECGNSKGHKGRKDLSVNTDKGAWKCHSSSCGFSGYLNTFETKEYSRPVALQYKDLPNNIASIFRKRGIEESVLKRFKVVYENRKLIFPYFRNGELINLKKRWSSNGKKQFSQHKDSEKIFYNLDSLVEQKEAIISEGEFDVLSWAQCGVGIGNVSVDMGAPQPRDKKVDGKLQCLTNCAEYFEGIEKVYIASDMDAAGERLRDELVRRLGSYRCYIVEFPKGCKDANDVLKEDGVYAHFTKEQREETLRLCLKNAKLMPMSGVIELDEDVEKRMLNAYLNGKDKGETTHFPTLDRHFKFLKHDISCVTGIPNHGKGLWTRQLMLMKAVFKGWKWACYVPEDFPVDEFYDDMCHTYIGKTSDKDYEQTRMTIEEYKKAIGFVKQHFFCIYPVPDKVTGKIDLPSNDWVNERITFLKLKYGVNAYVKDPWNKIFHNFSGREDVYLMKELSKEKFFASQFDASFYIAHPKTQQPIKKDGIVKGYHPPDAYSISGGAMFNNMFDNVIAVHRPNYWEDKSDTLVQIVVHKIKKQKLVGIPGTVEFFFDRPSNRYLNKDGFNPLGSIDIHEPLERIEEVLTEDDYEEIPF